MRRVGAVKSEDSALGARLAEILHEVTEGALRGHLSDLGSPLRELDISSRAMIAFLIAVEDELDFQWDIDAPEDVFFSLETIAAHLKEEGLAH